MKHKTTFEKLPQANTGRSKNWKTLRAICLLLFLTLIPQHFDLTLFISS